MKKLSILILFSLLFSLTCCLESRREQNKKKVSNASSISELVYLAYELRDDAFFPEICHLINDSINSDESFFWLQTITDINETTQEVSWSFIKENYPFPRVSEKLLFNICLEDKNTILIEHEPSDVSEIQKLAEKYIFYADSTDEKIKKERRNIDFFGEVEISKVAAILTSDVKGKKGLSIDEWTLFFKCLHELMAVFENKRNEISMKKWNQNFDSLPYEQRVAVANIVNYRITLVFNWKCYTKEMLTSESR